MKKLKYGHYIHGGIQLTVGFGIVHLLSRWITGNTILSSPESLIKYGITGGIGYSLMGAFALILFGFVAKYVRKHYPNLETIGDILREKLNPRGYWYMIGLLLFTSLDSMFVQAMGAAILFHMIFPVPLSITLLFFFAFCFILSGLGGMIRMHQLAGLHVTLIFATAIILPVYFFIQEGVLPIYQGIKLYHPYLLYYKNYDSIYFIVTAALIGFGQVLIDRATWQRLYMFKKERVQLTFTLSGIIWATIPIALSSMLMIAIFSGSFDDKQALLYLLIHKINSSFLFILFILFCISALTSTLNAELHSTSVLVVKNIIKEIFPKTTVRKLLLYSYSVNALFCIGLFMIVMILSPTLLELLFFFGGIYASIITPMLVILYSKGKVSSVIPFFSLFGLITSFLFKVQIGSLSSIWLSFSISTILCLFYVLTKKIKKNKPTEIFS
ncbi:sodium:solute symporter family transporter [Peribacillus alkalitolerans]|uniref:sodium:solute symporter family transporter n=1 Tax=Peribacillus alkalitolerans TaxID=1550385 RepID=UPI0013D36B48|nr:hypothetical protein [Peribacillus alkalitolerans]